jgi:hypothetical protein
MNPCAHWQIAPSIACPVCFPPSLHTWDGGKSFNTGGFGIADAEWLLNLVQNLQGRAIETGAGLSTLILLASKFKVTSIDGNPELISRIQAYLENGWESFNWTYRVGLSGEQLPGVEESFSVALIDGGHGFPIPFVDFYYINKILTGNGLLIVDDAQLPAPRELILNLCEMPTFYGLESISPSGKSYCFRKVHEFQSLPDFGGLGRDLRLGYQIENMNQDLFELKKSLQVYLRDSI